MPHYKETAAADIAHSLLQACTLLKSYSIGPQTDQTIDWFFAANAQGISPYDSIKNAADDAVLESAVRATNKFEWNALQEVFIFHAANNTDGIGEAVYAGLNQWNSFPPRLLDYMCAQDYEKMAFMSFVLTDLLRGQDSDILAVQTQNMSRYFSENVYDQNSVSRMNDAVSFFLSDAGFGEKFARTKDLTANEAGTIYTAALFKTSAHRLFTDFAEKITAAKKPGSKNPPPSFDM